MNITDEKLYYLCKAYGERALFWRRKFLGLLPEVYGRELYKKKGFSSIFEFAAKLAGISEEQVSRVLNLEKRFQDKPDLHKALINGGVSVNKLARIASIATVENQGLLVEQVRMLSQKALEVFVKDERVVVRAHKQDEKSQIEQPVTPEPKLMDKTKIKLCELQKKGIDIDEFILTAIERRGREVALEKAKLAQAQSVEKASRYVPVEIERVIQKEYGDKCAMPGCEHRADHLHHEIPFAILKNHNPYFLKPLCKEHHSIAHSVQWAYQCARKRYATLSP